MGTDLPVPGPGDPRREVSAWKRAGGFSGPGVHVYQVWAASSGAETGCGVGACDWNGWVFRMDAFVGLNINYLPDEWPALQIQLYMQSHGTSLPYMKEIYKYTFLILYGFYTPSSSQP